MKDKLNKDMQLIINVLEKANMELQFSLQESTSIFLAAERVAKIITTYESAKEPNIYGPKPIEEPNSEDSKLQVMESETKD